MTDNDRPQDVGRRHTRKRPDGPPDVLLERYQRTMRVWLTRLLDELDGAPPKPGLLDDVDAAAVTVYPDPITDDLPYMRPCVGDPSSEPRWRLFMPRGSRRIVRPAVRMQALVSACRCLDASLRRGGKRRYRRA